MGKIKLKFVQAFQKCSVVYVYDRCYSSWSLQMRTHDLLPHYSGVDNHFKIPTPYLSSNGCVMTSCLRFRVELRRIYFVVTTKASLNTQNNTTMYYWPTFNHMTYIFKTQNGLCIEKNACAWNKRYRSYDLLYVLKNNNMFC